MALIKAASLYTKPPKTGPGVNFDYRTHTLTVAQNVTDNLIAIGILPAKHRLVDLFLESADIDSGSGQVFDVGILNTYYNEPDASVADPAAYASGGATNTGTAPALVSGHNVITGATIGQAVGRAGPTVTLAPSKDIGVDNTKDRIIAVKVATQGATQVEGVIAIGYVTAED
jgi:hypothetical protein